MIKSGLLPIKRDARDYSFHKTFGGITPIALPQEFSVDSGFGFPDQTADGLYEACTAYAQLELCSDQDGKLYNTYRDLYQKTLDLEGAPFGQGCDIKDSLKMAITFYGRGAYYAVESSKMDWMDSICSVIYTNFVVNKLKCSVSIGTPWFKVWDVESTSSTGIIPDIFTGDPSNLSWHNWAIKGWKIINNEPYLLAKTWQGTHYGNGGWSYYSRATINAVMKIRGTGAFTVAPRSPDNVQTVRLTLLETILNFLKKVLGLQTQFNTMPQPITPPQTLETPPKIVVQPTPAPLSPLDWSTPVLARHAVRVICDEEGLSVEDKNDLCATVGAESGWNPNAIGKPNFDGTRDYGICQINTKYWIGANLTFPSTDYVLTHPAECIRWMCKEWKAGNKDWWYGWKSGNYKNYYQLI